MRNIIVFGYMFFSFLGLTPLMLHAKALKDRGDERYHDIVNKWVPRWMQKVLRLAGARVTVEGLEKIPAGPAVFIVNHQSMADIAVMLAYGGKPRAMLSKDVIRRVPFLSTWMQLFDCVYVVREKAEDARRSLRDCIALVQSGKDLVLFPEGTRSKNGQIGEFKSGAFRIAARVGVPLVPVIMEGTRDIFENNGNRIRPADVVMRVMDPIPTHEMSHEEVKGLEEMVHGKMSAELESIRAARAAAKQ